MKVKVKLLSPVQLLVSDKIDFKTKAVKRDKDGHYIILKGSFQEEDITIINMYAPNLGALQYVGPCAEAWPRGATQCLRSGSSARRSYPTPEVRGGARRSYPMPEVRGSSGEEQLHVQGAVAARAQEGREELLHVQGQKGRL